MNLRHLVLPLCALLVGGALSAAEGGHEEHGKAPAGEVEKATATGTVTALNPEKKSFTLKEDGASETNDYRAYYKSPDRQAILEKIAKLKVGDRVTISYTEAEGRRVITLEPAKADAKK